MQNRALNIPTIYGPAITAMLHGQVTKLSDIVNVMNISRRQRDPNAGELVTKDIIRTATFADCIFIVEEELGLRVRGDKTGLVLTYSANGRADSYIASLIQSPLVSYKRGRYSGGTWVHPKIAILLATHFDRALASYLIDQLVNSPIFQYRNDSGDLYKEAIDAVKSRFGNENIIQRITQLSRIVAERCGVEIRIDNHTWDYATEGQLQARLELNKMIIGFCSLPDFIIQDFFMLSASIAEVQPAHCMVLLPSQISLQAQNAVVMSIPAAPIIINDGIDDDDIYMPNIIDLDLYPYLHEIDGG